MSRFPDFAPLHPGYACYSASSLPGRHDSGVTRQSIAGKSFVAMDARVKPGHDEAG
jgi:hypothetical protein